MTKNKDFPKSEKPQAKEAHLRHENSRLKRQLAQAQRLIEKLETIDANFSCEPEGVEEKVKPPKAKKGPTCPECGSFDIAIIVTPNQVLVGACRTCKKWHGQIPKTEV